MKFMLNPKEYCTSFFCGLFLVADICVILFQKLTFFVLYGFEHFMEKANKTVFILLNMFLETGLFLENTDFSMRCRSASL